MKLNNLIAKTALLLALSVSSVYAQEHRHPIQDAPTHDKFYKGWMRPDNVNMSCCSLEDCAPVYMIRHSRNGIEAMRESDGAWLSIPKEKMEWKRDSPDGRSHMCSAAELVFCFVLGTGG